MKEQLTQIFKNYLESSSKESLQETIASILDDLGKQSTSQEAEHTPQEEKTEENIEPKPEEKHSEEEEERREDLRKDLYRFAWWDSGNQWDVHKTQFLASGGTQNEIVNIKKEAVAAKKRLSKLKRKILDGEITETKKSRNADIKQLRKDHPNFVNSINKDIQWAKSKRAEIVERIQNAEAIQNIRIPASKTPLIHIRNHQDEWVLLIDESGSSFSGEKNRTQSCFVGVLMPTSSNEPPIELHATDEGVRIKANAFNRLLNQKEASVIGLRLKEIPKVHGEQWIDGVTELIGWVMRLLPYENQTKLHVCIEQRQPHFEGTELSRLERMVLQSLVRVSPSRANDIRLRIRFIKKYNTHMIRVGTLDQEKTHPWLAFADIAAYLWNSNDDLFQSWVQKSNLPHQSFHYNIAPYHRRILDRLLSGEQLSGELWTHLLVDRAKNRSSILKYIDEGWKEKAQKCSEQWELLLEHTVDHIYSKAVNMTVLSHQVRWLKSVNQEKTYDLSLKEQLAFDIATLSYRNHCGEIISMDEIQAFQVKKRALYNEDVRLVCDLDLHLAVQLTHYFGFAYAQKLMESWEKEPIHTIGINKKGRVLSTIGQQYAFTYNSTKAIEYFDAALDTFSQLCSPKEQQAEQRHTRSYKVCTMIDTPTISNEEIEHELLLLHPEHADMKSLCTQLASSNEDATKYTHHLMVRYFYFRSPPALITLYLSFERSWKSGKWHPWPWIDMYRGLLLHEQNSEKAKRFLNRAIHNTPKNGIEGLVRVVFLVLQRNSTSITLDANIQADIDSVRANIPNAKAAISVLESVIQESNPDPRVWIAKVLPFNFH